MPTTPNKKLLSDPRVPRISFDDQDWPVPRLAPAQLEVVLPLLSATLPKIETQGSGMAVMTREVLHDLGTIVFLGLQRGHEDLTREEFDQMPIGLLELVSSAYVVLQQCGTFRKRQNTEVNGVPLEPTAASTPTGSPSPPSS
jgi:hypothetical protein